MNYKIYTNRATHSYIFWIASSFVLFSLDNMSSLACVVDCMCIACCSSLSCRSSLSRLRLSDCSLSISFPNSLTFPLSWAASSSLSWMKKQINRYEAIYSYCLVIFSPPGVISFYCSWWRRDEIYCNWTCRDTFIQSTCTSLSTLSHVPCVLY